MCLLSVFFLFCVGCLCVCLFVRFACVFFLFVLCLDCVVENLIFLDKKDARLFGLFFIVFSVLCMWLCVFCLLCCLVVWLIVCLCLCVVCCVIVLFVLSLFVCFCFFVKNMCVCLVV